MPRSKDKRVRSLMTAVAQNLRRVREHRGLSQSDVVKQLQLGTANGLARWERGEQWLDPASLKLLADFYQFPLEQFFMEDPPWLARLDGGNPKRATH